MNTIKNKLDNLSDTAKGGLWFSFASFFQSALTLIATPIFSRLLTLEEAGQFSLYQTWYSIFSVVCTLNITGAAFMPIMHDCKSDQEQKDIIYNSFILSVFLSLSVFLIYGSFSLNNFNLPGLSFELFLLIAISILVDIPVKLYIGYSRYNNKYKNCCLLMISQSIISFTLSILFVVLSNENRVLNRIVGKEAGYLIILVLSTIFILKRKSFILDLKLLKSIFVVVSPLVFHYLSQDVLSQADRLILQINQGDGVVGIYSLVYNFINIMLIIITAFDSFFNPWVIKKIGDKDKEKVFKVTSLFFMLMFFVISCCSFISKEIILVFGGEKYLSGTNVVPLLLMTVYCVMIYDFVSNIQFYFKKTIYASIFTVVAAGINIGLDYWLIPNYSMIGAAIGTVISYLILALLHCILSSYYSKKKLGIKDFFYTKRLALISLCGIIVNGVAYLIYDYDLVRWICFGLFFVSFFIFAFWKRYDIKELVTKKKDNNA